jgi:hypothetical protein
MLVVGAKPCVYGNGLGCSTMICRPALPVPVSVPASTVGMPNPTGLGVAAMLSPSGWARVRKLRSAPLAMPLWLVATSR